MSRVSLRTAGTPAPNTENHPYTGLRLSGEAVPGENMSKTSDKMGRHCSLCPGQPSGGGGGLRRSQITLRTVFNICKTATRAAKVNSVPGSSKVSGFKYFPFA